MTPCLAHWQRAEQIREYVAAAREEATRKTGEEGRSKALEFDLTFVESYFFPSKATKCLNYVKLLLIYVW